VSLFQIALAAGMPWGSYAMGGAYPGVYPPGMRIAALAQILVYAAVGAIVLSRAGLALPGFARPARMLIWSVVAVFGAATILNLITPSAVERALWAPFAFLMLLASLRLALGRD